MKLNKRKYCTVRRSPTAGVKVAPNSSGLVLFLEARSGSYKPEKTNVWGRGQALDLSS